jgi:serine/threonine-protein kinase RsbW
MIKNLPSLAHVKSNSDRSQYTLRLEIPALYDRLTILKDSLDLLFKRANWPGGPEKDSLLHQIRLAIHENCTNIIEHAYHGQSGVIEVLYTLQKKPARFIVDLYDHGQSFDISIVTSPDLSQANNRGYGLFLIHQLMDEVSYDPLHGLNHWRLIKNLPEETDRG